MGNIKGVVVHCSVIPKEVDELLAKHAIQMSIGVLTFTLNVCGA